MPKRLVSVVRSFGLKTSIFSPLLLKYDGASEWPPRQTDSGRAARAVLSTIR